MVETVENYSEFMPRTRKMTFGTGPLVVKELNVAKRDALVKVIFSDFDFASMIKPFMEMYKIRQKRKRKVVAELMALKLEDDELQDAIVKKMAEEEDDDMDVSSLAERAQEIIFKLLSNDLTVVACLTLDIEENRKTLEIGDKPVPHPDYGFLHCPAMFRWVRENMLPRFETVMLDAVNETNDFVGLVKNWETLVAKIAASTRETGSTEKSPETQEDSD